MTTRGSLLVNTGLYTLFVLLLVSTAISQSSERTFARAKTAIEQKVRKLQPTMSGRLPTLEGFVANSDQPLERYRRGYYQTSVQIRAASSGNSVVHVSTKITAWYVDPEGVHSGYRVLNSNGRLESDLLDQLADELASDANAGDPSSRTSTPIEARNPASSEQTIREPESPNEHKVQQPVVAAGPFSAPLSPSLPSRGEVSSTGRSDREMQDEIKSLEEILRNQAHPDNLVAVKQSGTAVVASPSLSAKTLFLASAHDEFEMLDFNSDWVHVRISGLSRGWIWRNSVEMPDGIPDTAPRSATGPKAVAEQLFHVTREETALFPGDWEPLKGKTVKILSVERVDESRGDSGLIMRLEFAKAQIQKSYDELAKESDTLAGIVLIFDSADGGLMAATLPAMQKWRAGILSDSAFWHQCFFDPPEMGGGTGTSASQ